MERFARRFARVAAGILLAACAGNAPEMAAFGPPDETSISFIVIGDTPYSVDDEAMLAQALPMVKAGAYPFVIHVGDYKGGGAACSADHDDRFAALIEALAPIPVFYTPGDNEWTDCDRKNDPATGRTWSELARLKAVRTRFFGEAPRVAKASEYERQAAQPENASWRHGGVRFATVHVVGTANGRIWALGDPLDAVAEATDARDAANLAWITHVLSLAKSQSAKALVIAMQADIAGENKASPACIGATDHGAKCDAYADLRKALQAAAMEFCGPMLVIHGDTAPFSLDRQFAGDEAPNLWRLNSAGDAGLGIAGEFYGTRDVTEVKYDPAAPTPFSARGLATGKLPKGAPTDAARADASCNAGRDPATASLRR